MVTTRLPGLGLAALGGGVALAVHALVPVLSPTLVAIALGIAVAASGGVRGSARPGLRVASRQVLRVGVALLGLQLLLPEILALGWQMLVVIAGVVLIGIGGTLALGRLLGVESERALLVACGFSICGAAAVAAVEGVRDSKDEDVATAVSLVVVFGSVVMLVLPLGALALGFDPIAAGAWSGASIHEVGQVVVAGGLAGGAALQVAVAVKLGRVLMLAPVLAVISARTRRTSGVRPPLVPGFVLAFLALATVNSIGLVPAVIRNFVSDLSRWALLVAIAAVGMKTSLRTILDVGGQAIVLIVAETTFLAIFILAGLHLLN
jgi:uncharacterized integral membrane protein (TIGR00698 family)